MSQNSTDDSDKKEAAKFYTNWMKNKQDNWDEVCLQWCKQRKEARKDQADPNCSMLCFQSPTDNYLFEKSWNPLKGYSVIVVQGKEECSTHVEGMKHTKETQSDFITSTSSKYVIDLGNLWNEAHVGAKYLYDKKVVPMYQSTVEQASDWAKGPEAAEMKGYVKEKTDILYKQVFQTSPPSLNKDDKE